MSPRNSSESSASASSSSSSCAPCRRLLQQVLERHESRPRSLLSSMLPLPADHLSRSSNNSHNNKSSTLNWRLSPSGDIQVQIPTEEATQRVNTQRRWSRLPQTATITTTNNNNENEKNDNVKTSSSSSTPLQRFTSAPPLMQATSSLEAAQRQQKQQQQSVLLSPTNDKNDDNTNLATSSTTTLMSSLLPSSLSSAAATAATSTTSASSKSNAANTNTATTTTTEWMNVSCQVCPNTGPKGKARAFVNGPNPLDVVVCSNRLRHSSNNNDSDDDNNNKAALQEMEEILTHELVHVFDVRGRNLDLRQCENLAYSEVRAAREAECQRTSTALGLQRSCVHERALLATRNLFPATQARECVRRVFAAAYADVQPDATPTTTTAAMGNTNGSSATATTTTTNASSSSSWQATSQR